MPSVLLTIVLKLRMSYNERELRSGTLGPGANVSVRQQGTGEEGQNWHVPVLSQGFFKEMKVCF